jgi:hypothetical protein
MLIVGMVRAGRETSSAASAVFVGSYSARIASDTPPRLAYRDQTPGYLWPKLVAFRFPQERQSHHDSRLEVRNIVGIPGSPQLERSPGSGNCTKFIKKYSIFPTLPEMMSRGSNALDT